MDTPSVAAFPLLLWLISSLASAAQPNDLSNTSIPQGWPPARKQAIGTAYEPEDQAFSPVWFTVAEGVPTEVFYPQVDHPQIAGLQFLITDDQSYFSDPKVDAVTNVIYLNDGMTVQISALERSGFYSYEQEIITSPSMPAVRFHTTFHSFRPGLRLFILMSPAIQNSTSDNYALATREALFATRDGVHAALSLSPKKFLTESAGYAGFSDGYQDLFYNFRITDPVHNAGPGTVVLTGEIPLTGQETQFELTLSFGQSQEEALFLAKSAASLAFQTTQEEYESGWRLYLSKLRDSLIPSPLVQRSAQIIKMHEDKRNRGAIVASLSKPAISEKSGYHLISPHDLYKAAVALLAAGDVSTAYRSLNYYAKTQQADGSWAQTFWIDGKEYGTTSSFEQAAFPILLANQMGIHTSIKLSTVHLNMIRKAALYLQSREPKSSEGYSPSSFAYGVSALRSAAKILKDPQFSKTAELWQSILERRTFVLDGPNGKNYYLKISPEGNPTEAEPIQLPHNGERAFSTEILDSSFLDLVRMGVRGFDDPRVSNTLHMIESPVFGVSESFASGLAFRRYNHDNYGPMHLGGFWPLLSGERGHYALAAHDFERADAELYRFELTASQTGLFPEQVIRFPDEVGLGVACPFVWAHAEHILLKRSIEEGSIYDAPVDSR